MKTNNIERYLNSFGKQVVNRSKGNLQRTKGKTKLGESIRFEVVTDPKGFSVNFYMSDYGSFLDRGVSGNKKTQSYKNYKGEILKSPFAYTSKQPPADILAKWISKKRIKGRDVKTGRFISNLSLAFIFAKKIKRDGIKSLSFFQKPLGLGMKQFGQHLLGAIAEDIKNSISKTQVK